jgi:F-type H+-transporting ATPase subunit b
MSLVSVTDLGSVLSSSSSTVMDAITGARMSAGGSAVEVDFDATVIFMVVLFLILWVILKPVLFDPMLRLFEERERRIDGAKLLARKIDQKSANALAEYEDQMQKARTAANAEREKIRAEAVRREQEILGAVRAATAKTIDDGKRAAEAEAARVRATLKEGAGLLARDVAARVLGREVQS